MVLGLWDPCLVSGMITRCGYPSTVAAKESSGTAPPDFQFPVSVSTLAVSPGMKAGPPQGKRSRSVDSPSQGKGGLPCSSPLLWAWTRGNSEPCASATPGALGCLCPTPHWCRDHLQAGASQTRREFLHPALLACQPQPRLCPE